MGEVMYRFVEVGHNQLDFVVANRPESHLTKLLGIIGQNQNNLMHVLSTWQLTIRLFSRES
jgi:hypothetical protein